MASSVLNDEPIRQTNEYRRWAIGRFERDQEASAKGHRRTPSASVDSDKGKATAKAETTKENTKSGSEKSQEKRIHSREFSGPFLDRQLDKALEVLRSKLGANAKSKAA